MTDNVAMQARPHYELIEEIRDSRIAKTEREHAAGREIERLLNLLDDWQTFAKDVSAADCAGQEWLDTLRARTEEVLKP